MTGAGVFSITGVNFNAKDIESLIRFQSLLMSLEGEWTATGRENARRRGGRRRANACLGPEQRDVAPVQGG